MLFDLDKLTYSILSLVLLALSIKFEGARAYTPLLCIIVALELLGLQRIQILTILLTGIVSVIFAVYDINVPVRGPFLMGHRYKYLPQKDGSTLQLSLFYPTLTPGSRV